MNRPQFLTAHGGLAMTQIPHSVQTMAAFMAHPTQSENVPKPLAAARWDWEPVRKVLVIRLRSIGDTVLATPSLRALRRFLPNAQIDILLEDWVAPVVENSQDIDNVITVKRKSAADRARVARVLRARRYDVVYNLHGGSTSTFLTRATGARYRVGFSNYRYSGLHNHAAPSPMELWGREEIHSVEQQLALLGWTGVPVTDLPPTQLFVNPSAALAMKKRLHDSGIDEDRRIALLHPAAAFDTKQWATENFARVSEYLSRNGYAPVVIVAKNEFHIAAELQKASSVPVTSYADLSLPEVTVLAARASLFVGNDSGIAHIAAAVRCPTVVIFGSSNVTHWRPWSSAPSAMVREELPCQPCPGYTCGEFDEPQCIRRIKVESVTVAIENVLKQMSDVS